MMQFENVANQGQRHDFLFLGGGGESCLVLCFLSCLALSCLAVLFFFILSCLVSSSFVLSCRLFLDLVLSYVVLS